MLVTFYSIHVCYICSSKPIGRKQFCIQSQPRSKNTFVLASRETLLTRRIAAISSWTTLVSGLIYNTLALPIQAEEDNNRNDPKDEGDNGALGIIESIFDPNEKTKTGKLLPKAYLKDAREVVKTLRESLEEDAKDASKFRRSADAAKESIRQYLSNWRGQSAVVAEESYEAIEKAIRTLANFYSKAGPSATMTEEVKATILGDLKTAEDFL